MILMLSETGLQADKMDTSNKRTFLLYSPIPQMANVTKNSLKDSKKEKYVSCTQNVQPMFVTKTKNKETSFYTAKHTS